MIDADELFHVVAGHHDLFKGATLRTDKARRDELLQVMVDINDAPTIDAIPVEWIRNIKENLPESIEKMGLDAVLILWAQEQEAR